MDSGRSDSGLAGRSSHEGWRLRHSGRHHPWTARRHSGRLDIRTVGNLARRRHDWLDYSGICGRRDFGLDYPAPQKGLSELVAQHKKSRCYYKLAVELKDKIAESCVLD